MYFLVSADQMQRVATEIRRKRLNSSLRLYVPCVAIFTGLAVLYLVTRGHMFVRALMRTLDGRFTEIQIIGGLAVIACIVAAVATALLLRSMFRERLFEEHLFCPGCAAVDKDDDGSCPFCGGELLQRQSFFTTVYDDEIRLAQRIGLREAKEV
jgi:hypothetical protein